jgi:P22_AR N-terminal domain
MMSKKSLTRIGLKVEVHVEFKDLFKVRLLLGDDGRRRVVPSELADELGLDRQAMHRRMERTRIAKGLAIMPIPSLGGPQDTITLDVKRLPALLLGIEVGRVKPAIRPRLGEIQDELTDALAAYVFQGIAVNPAFAAARPTKLLLPATNRDVRALSARMVDQVNTIGIGGEAGERVLAGAQALDRVVADQDPDLPVDPRLAKHLRAYAEQVAFIDTLSEVAAHVGKTDQLGEILAMGPAVARMVRATKAERRASRGA